MTTQTTRQSNRYSTKKETYAAKLETLRRKEARKIKYASPSK